MAGGGRVIVDLFRGPGGWSEGLLQLGMRDWGVEICPTAHTTAQMAGHVGALADVVHYDPRCQPSVAGVIASPVCKPFSRAGKQAGLLDQRLVHQAIADLADGRDTRTVLRSQCKDSESLLTAEPMRFLHAWRPDWVAMEQVPDVLPVWQQYAQILRGWGYSAWTGILNAADYGVPQTRRRAILIANRHQPVTPPEAVHAEHPELDGLFGPGRLPWRSMADALDWTDGLTVNTRGDRRTAGGNEFSADGPSWALTEKTRSWWVLRQGKRSNATVRRLDQPAATLVAGHSRRDYQWHTVGDGPTQRRQLTIPEAAVLQSFRPDYPFAGSESKAFQQIANAVPPLLAAHVIAAATGLPAPRLTALDPARSTP
jgi:DNA (cytosine-5)-methyltransferase 1